MRGGVLRGAVIGYSALLIGPVPTLAPFSPWLSFAFGALAGGLLGAVVVQTLDLPDAVLGLPRVLAGFALPVLWLVVAAVETTTPVGFLLSPWFVGALAALIWLAVVIRAAGIRKRARLDAISTITSFEARMPPAERRQLRIAVGVLAVAAGSMIVGVVVLDAETHVTDLLAFVWVPATVPVWIMIAQNGTARDVSLTDSGIVVNTSVQRWETITDVELTDEALIVRRRGWYRGKLTFDRDDIEDVEAITTVIEERSAG